MTCNFDCVFSESTHIRILAFSPAGIKSCTAQIGNGFKETCRQINDNFFVVSWDPKRFEKGLHFITVTMADNADRVNQVEQPFRLDDQQTLKFDMMALFVLKTDATTIFKGLFYMALITCISPLIFIRIWHELVKGKTLTLKTYISWIIQIELLFFQPLLHLAGLLSRRRASCRTSMSMLQQLWILSSVDRLFWPIILYCVYLAVGPWVICEIVDGRYGAVFVWGIYLDGAFLPGSLTYFYGFSQILLCQCPLNWIFSKRLTKTYYQAIGMPTKNHRGWCTPRKITRVAFYFIIIIEIALSIFFGILYGSVAFILGVFRTWSVIMNIYLYYLTRNLPDHALRFVFVVKFLFNLSLTDDQYNYRSAIFVWTGGDKPLNEDQSAQSNET